MRFAGARNSKKTKTYKANREKDNKETSEFSDKEVTAENIRDILSDSSDVIYQLHYINGCRDLPVTVVFVDGLVDTKIVNDDVLKPLTQENVLKAAKDNDSLIDLIEHGTIYHSSRKLRISLGETLADILDGAVALVFDKEKKAITFDIKNFLKRSIAEPTNESALKGSKDSFIEVLRVNTSLVRRKNPHALFADKGNHCGKTIANTNRCHLYRKPD